MPCRRVSIALIMTLFFGTLVWVFTYGPANRTFVVPHKAVEVRSTRELDGLWRKSGVHGRIAVIFGVHLNGVFQHSQIPGNDYLDGAMRHGIVRTAYFIVPDADYSHFVSEIMADRALLSPPMKTDTGDLLLHEAGRVYIIPFSKYVPDPGAEKVLVVIEPAVWAQQEQLRIDGLIKSGQLASDLTVFVGNMESPLTRR